LNESHPALPVDELNWKQHKFDATRRQMRPPAEPVALTATARILWGGNLVRIRV
jgi:hypothetical protein